MERQLGYECKGTAGVRYPYHKYHGQQVKKKEYSHLPEAKEIPSDDKQRICCGCSSEFR